MYFNKTKVVPDIFISCIQKIYICSEKMNVNLQTSRVAL